MPPRARAQKRRCAPIAIPIMIPATNAAAVVTSAVHVVDTAVHGVLRRAVAAPASCGLLRGPLLAPTSAHEVMAMVAAYRNDEDVLRARIGALLEERSSELRGVAGAPRSIHARRVARAAAGGVAALGGVTMMLVSLAYAESLWRGSDTHGLLLRMLGGIWAAGATAYVLGRIGGGWAFDRAVARAPAATGNPRIDRVRIERRMPRRVARALLDRVEAWSAGLPLAAIGLLAPLSLHFVVWLVATRASDLGPFDKWIQLSVITVGIAHVTLAICGGVFASRLRREPTASLRPTSTRAGVRALGYTVVASLFPGAVLFLIPPLVVLVTGILFVPLAFWRMGSTIQTEREAIDRAIDVC